MPTILLTIAVLGAVMFGMAIGVILAGKRLKGSCGGVGTSCECTDAQRREAAIAKAEEAWLAASSALETA